MNKYRGIVATALTITAILIPVIILLLGLVSGMKISNSSVRLALGVESVIGLVILLLHKSPDKKVEVLPDTIMKPRTIEDVEKLVEELEEKNRTLLSNYRDTTALLREKQLNFDDQEVYCKFLEAGLDDRLDNFSAACKRLLLLIRGPFHASAAVVWIIENDSNQMFAAGTSGQVAPSILDNPVKIKSAMLPSELRLLCEAQMRFAAPPSFDKPEPFLPEDKNIIDPPIDTSPLYLGSTLRVHDQIIGVVVLAPASNCRFQTKDLARLNHLSTAFALALFAIGNRPEAVAVVENKESYEVKKS